MQISVDLIIYQYVRTGLNRDRAPPLRVNAHVDGFVQHVGGKGDRR